MNQKNKLTPQKLFVACCLLGFALFFCFFLKRDLPKIFEKDLRLHDESVNSVVAANVVRKVFPPMVRVNPLIKTQGIWMEGPYWQHIPPLFAYVPLPFFKLDGHITIETKRLAYALVVLLTGLLFILSVALFEKKVFAVLAATLAACIWNFTPFTRRLITGFSFGASDIVLSFMVICSFATICWYLSDSRHERKNYPWWRLVLVSIVVALPIVTKNVLGAIPAATFFLISLYDQKRINIKFLLSVFTFFGLLAVFFFPLYLSSPETFKQEILVSFSHTHNYEGWARPWNIFFTDYLPNYYLKPFIWAFGAGLLAGLYLFAKRAITPRAKILLLLSGGWFMWNLLVASIITSKAPNFIFQAYLLAVFFSVYSLALLLQKFFSGLHFDFNELRIIYEKSSSFFNKALLVCSVLLLIATGAYYFRLFKKIEKTRAAPYAYNSEHEQFYYFGEIAQKQGINDKDIFILNSTQDDCWFRYYILFLTGAESKDFDEILLENPSAAVLQQKYNKMYLVITNTDKTPNVNIPHTIQTMGNFQVLIFDTKSLGSDYISTLKSWLANFKNKTIYQSNQSCQWLLPE